MTLYEPDNGYLAPLEGNDQQSSFTETASDTSDPMASGLLFHRQIDEILSKIR